jgi:prolyl-tRNA synthetase
MRYENLFGKTLKESPKEEISINAQYLIRGGFVDKLMSGVYTQLPLGWKVLEKIHGVIREEMDGVGGQELFMPALHPRSLWEETGRWEALKEIMYIIKDASGKEIALGTTHEEIIADLARRRIYSYKDLPFALYQIQTKFRNEPRAKSGLLRGREFIMKDLYSFHSCVQDLDRYYEKVQTAYLKIFNRVGLEALMVEASGGTFTKNYSHEFQVLSESGEDKTIYCPGCRFAQNVEITNLKEGDPCPSCRDFLKVSKSIEVGNIFKFGSKYADQMGVFFIDIHGQRKPVLLASYGIGTTRLMGTVVEIHHDEKGIIWPPSIAPYQAHLVTLSVKPDVVKEAEKIYRHLAKAGVEVLLDARDESAGVKLADADLIGVPVRLAVSDRTMAKGKIELKKRHESEISYYTLDEVTKFLKNRL